MKKILFFIAIIMCFVTSVNAQILTDNEWAKVKENARLIYSYNDINENDSVLDLRYLDHGIMCCKTCIGYMSMCNDINSLLQKIYIKVNKYNAAELHNNFTELSELMIQTHKYWLVHMEGNFCRRGRFDGPMYFIIGQEFLEYGEKQQEITFKKIYSFL